MKQIWLAWYLENSHQRRAWYLIIVTYKTISFIFVLIDFHCKQACRYARIPLKTESYLHKFLSKISSNSLRFCCTLGLLPGKCTHEKCNLWAAAYGRVNSSAWQENIYPLVYEYCYNVSAWFIIVFADHIKEIHCEARIYDILL